MIVDEDYTNKATSFTQIINKFQNGIKPILT